MVARGNNLSLCNIPNQYLRKKTLRMTEVPLRCSIKWVVVSSNAVENVQHKRNKKETSLKGQAELRQQNSLIKNILNINNGFSCVML